MTRGPIDWEHPPSTRVQRPALGRRLGFDAVVLGSCVAIAWVLLAALRGAPGVSARGVRQFLVEGLGSEFLVWGVLAAVSLAALYCAADALLLLRRLLGGTREPGSRGGDA